MGKRVRVISALGIFLLILTACGSGPGYDGLPERPSATGGPTPQGHIAYQLPFLPIVLSVDANGVVSVTLNSRLVTLLGVVTVSAGVAKDSAGQPLQRQPVDVTQLIVCQRGSDGQRCQAYEIDTGRKIHIEMNGSFVQNIERNRITIDAAPGSTIRLTDNGPPAKLEAFGPARADVEEFHFNESGEDTDVDVERSRSGTTTDLSYDHITAELKPIHGAMVSLYAKYGSWDAPSKRSDYPGEQECLQKRREDWKDSFNKNDLKEKYDVFCIKTAEGDLGFLLIEPDFTQKPTAYYVYADTWVR